MTAEIEGMSDVVARVAERNGTVRVLVGSR